MKYLARLGFVVVGVNWSFLMVAPALCSSVQAHHPAVLLALMLVAWAFSTRLFVRLGVDRMRGGAGRQVHGFAVAVGDPHVLASPSHGHAAAAAR